MGEKDTAEKVLEDYNDVFADIVNVLLFEGKELMKEEELSNAKDKSQYKAENRLHEQERDVSKFWSRGEVRIALCGLENQTLIDKDMPFRVIGYDGSAYRSQLTEGKKRRYPVVTMVLYFGLKPWEGKRSLYECLEIPEEIRPYVSDYRINVFEIAYLEEEQVKRFKSDFRFVADYFVQIRKNRDYKPSRETIRHVDELLKLMTVLTEDERFIEAQNQSEGGVRNMCEVLDRAEERGRAEGKAEGKAEGRVEGRAEGKIVAYADVGLTVTEIAEKMRLSEEEIKTVLKEEGILKE